MLDVFDGAISPEAVMRMDLPFVMDLVKAKIRLEESKSKAQKAAKELAQIQKSGSKIF